MMMERAESCPVLVCWKKRTGAVAPVHSGANKLRVRWTCLGSYERSKARSTERDLEGFGA